MNFFSRYWRSRGEELVPILACKHALSGTSPTPPDQCVGMERMPRKSPAVCIADPEPIDSGCIQMLHDYLDRIQDRITTKPEPSHQRLSLARRPRVGNAEIKAIHSAQFVWPRHDPVPPRWLRDTVVLWAREIVEAEVLSSSLRTKHPSRPFPGCRTGEREVDLPR